MANKQSYKFQYVSRLRDKIKSVIGDKLESFLNENFPLHNYSNSLLDVHFKFVILTDKIIHSIKSYVHYDEKKHILEICSLYSAENLIAIDDIQLYYKFYEFFKHILDNPNLHVDFNSSKLAYDISMYKFLHSKKKETTK